MVIEIVDLPSYKMVIFHSYINVYQRVHDKQQNSRQTEMTIMRYDYISVYGRNMHYYPLVN